MGTLECPITHHPSLMPHSRLSSGFTLIELLVTLVILGIAVALVSVRLAPDGSKELATEAQRLSLLLQQARDEAISSGQSIALDLEGRRYAFVLHNRKSLSENQTPDWQPHPDSIFRPRELPEGCTLSMLEPAGGERIIFSPSGALLPFRLRMQSQSGQTSITGRTSGAIQVEEQPGT